MVTGSVALLPRQPLQLLGATSSVVETAPKAVERPRSRSPRLPQNPRVRPRRYPFRSHIARTLREHRERLESLERQIAIAHRGFDSLIELTQRQHAYAQRQRRVLETQQDRFHCLLRNHLTLFERQSELDGAARALDSFVTALQTAHSQRLGVLETAYQHIWERHIRLLQTTRDLLEAAELLSLPSLPSCRAAELAQGLPSLLREALNSLPDELPFTPIPYADGYTDAGSSSSALTPGAALRQAQSDLRFAFDNLYLDVPR